jgi:hypothetical protein
MGMSKPFDKQMKRLAQTSPETLLQWLLPGATYVKELPLPLEITDFEYERSEDADLLVIGYNLAMLALKRHKSADLDWLLKEFIYMQERFEDSPFYQMIEARALEKSLNEVLKKDREAILKVVEAKYPNAGLVPLAEALTAYLQDQDVLLNLLIQISITTLPEEARSALVASVQGTQTKH